MARPNKPTGAKIVQGTFRKCRANPNEPEPIPVEEIPEPPRGMSKAAKEEWRLVIGYILNNKIVGAEGLSIVATYCRMHATIKSEKDILKIPASYIAQYRALAGSLGLTGDSRAKIKAGSKTPSKSNPFEAFK